MLTKNKTGLEWAATSNNGADMTLKDFREYLAGECRKAARDEGGSDLGVRALSRKTGLSPAQISKVLNGEEIPGDGFLSVFGFKRRITIVRK